MGLLHAADPPPPPPAPGKPTIVLVPGAWHRSSVYASVILLLERAGYQCLTVELPSVGGCVSSLAEDTDEICTLLAKLVCAGKDVVLVMHSYGGLPGAAAVRGLGKREGRQGGVTHLVFLGSFILDEGEAALDLLAGQLPPWVAPENDGKTLRCINPEELWYHELLPGEARRWAAQLRPQCAITFLDPLPYAGWRHIPSTYLITELDRAVPLSVQESMLSKAKCSTLRVERARAGHAVMLSHPGVVARCVRRAAGEGL
ncbi:alpha/beta-hydrolase [Calocera viscosa TUFC12733]|uniref:Alpha/beta-hydrolase n=1 Tax=Calocera viscosa (strain TUFC12733) TaxID=1330018 RepID=A0A167MRE8_CALVF|nr:alpha/beta-hydrolase [Calocera viscosa TUFC12733]